jgi:hypothetical protein
MPIIRASHDRSSRWFLLARESAQDNRLSFRARGVLAYLLSKPDGWEWREAELLDAGAEGRDAVRSALRELKDAGYLTTARQQHPTTGKWEWVKTIHEIPIDGFSGDGFPGDGKPGNGFPGDGFPGHIENTEERVQRESTESESPPPPPTPSGPTPGTPSAGGGGDVRADPPGRSPAPIALSGESIPLLRAAGVKSAAALAKAAGLPAPVVRLVIAAAASRPAEHRPGWIARECAALAALPADDRAAALPVAPPAPPTAPPAPPLPAAPPLSADERRAILAARRC